MNKMRIEHFWIVCLLVFVALRAEASEPSDKDLTIRQIIEKYYSQSNFYFGCISKAKFFTTGEADKRVYLREFIYNTPENEFKQRVVYPSLGAKWQDEDYRKLLDMARENKQVVRAHCPVSPQCSEWVREDTRTASELREVMTTFMTRMGKVLEENRDVVKWMDVVNETVCPTLYRGIGYDAQSTSDNIQYQPGDWFGPKLGNKSWENPWTIIGFEKDKLLRLPTYIRLAFELANQYAPDVKKVYNQNGGMEDAAWEKIKSTVLYLRSAGLKVDALGWQAHVPSGFEKIPGNLDKLSSLIDWCNQHGLEFHLTELDVKLGKNFDYSKIKEKEEEIAQTYGAIVETVLKKVGKGAVAINCWSMKDRSSQEGFCFAGLFDSDLKPTPAYYRIKGLLLKYAPGR